MKLHRQKVWIETPHGYWVRHRLNHSSYCFYCGGSKELTWDHKTPRSRGGINHRSNLVRCCYQCNQRKGAMTVDEFLKQGDN